MKNIATAFVLSLLSIGLAYAQTSNSPNKNIMKNIQENSGYTFKISDKVTRQKVTFKNRYGITLTGDLYLPKDSGNKKMAALAISGPFGAVKEQSSGLYANQMAERGFAA